MSDHNEPAATDDAAPEQAPPPPPAFEPDPSIVIPEVKEGERASPPPRPMPTQEED